MKLRSFEATVKPEHLPDIIKQKKCIHKKKPYKNTILITQVQIKCSSKLAVLVREPTKEKNKV